MSDLCHRYTRNALHTRDFNVFSIGKRRVKDSPDVSPLPLSYVHNTNSDHLKYAAE